LSQSTNRLPLTLLPLTPPPSTLPPLTLNTKNLPTILGSFSLIYWLIERLMNFKMCVFKRLYHPGRSIICAFILKECKYKHYRTD
jgi:hypothetical protein